MARKCSSPGCVVSLPDKYPLDKCPWHLAPGRGPVKIAAAVAIAAAGFGGGMAYKKFRAYLRDKESRKQVAAKRNSQKRTRTRKKSATKSKRQPAKSEISS
jgi:Na+/glutamate symporter